MPAIAALALSEDASENFASAINAISDDELDELDGDSRVTIDSSTLRSSRSAPKPSRGRSQVPTQAGKRKAPVIVDDDSDEGTFKGFGARKRIRR
jgi:hypothetical protein